MVFCHVSKMLPTIGYGFECSVHFVEATCEQKVILVTDYVTGLKKVEPCEW
jgi:hypothetical protein